MAVDGCRFSDLPLTSGLDCTISLGFPGSVASLRQQFGRAGRAGRLGLSFYVPWHGKRVKDILNIS